MKRPPVIAIVLNWDQGQLTCDCLASLTDVTYENLKILVVDNGSTDDSVDRIRTKFPHVDILELPSNVGYARGNNEGFRHAKQWSPEFVIFLNNDTVVDSQFIEPLVDPFERNGRIGQTSPKIYYADDTRRIWYAGASVNFWTGQISHRGIRKRDRGQFNTSETTSYATGCCFCIRTGDFDSLGGFDETFALYGEDVDLSLRFRNMGKTIQYVPHSKVWHKVSSSAGGALSRDKLRPKLTGLIRVFSKHATWMQKVFIVIFWSVVLIPYYFSKLGYLRLKEKMSKNRFLHKKNRETSF